MKVDIEESGTLSRTITFTISKEQVQKEFNKFFDEVRGKVDMPGFRKGKATNQAIQLKYSDLSKAEVSARLIYGAVTDLIKENNVRIAGNPVITDEHRATEKRTHVGDFRLDGSFICTVSAEIEPTLDVKDYIGIEVSESLPDMSRWLEERLQDFQYTFASRQQITDRNTKLEDEIVVDIEYFKDGISVPDTKIEMQTIFIDANGEDTPLLINRSLKEEFEVPVSGDEGVTRKIFIHSIAEVTKPAIDDTLAKLATYDSLESMKADLVSRGEKEFVAPIKIKIFNEVMSHILEKNPFDIPGAWVESESRITAMRLGFKELPKEEALLNSIREIAYRVVKQNFALDRIYENETTIHLSANDIKMILGSEARKHNRSIDQEIAYLKNSEQYEGLIALHEHNRTIDFVLNSARVREK